MLKLNKNPIETLCLFDSESTAAFALIKEYFNSIQHLIFTTNMVNIGKKTVDDLKEADKKERNLHLEMPGAIATINRQSNLYCPGAVEDWEPDTPMCVIKEAICAYFNYKL